MDTPSQRLREFWRQRLYGTLTTVRPDGLPHVTPVGITVDDGLAVARVICSAGSVKARNVRAATGGAPVALNQFDRGVWSTLEGRAVVLDDPATVRDAERRYTLRYGKDPRPNPARVVLEITVTRRLGLS